MKNALSILFVLFCFSCNAQEKAILIESPNSNSFEEKDLVWNKWDTDNFIILSLDKSQGLKIRDNVENIRTNFLETWSTECSSSSLCKLICVPDQKTLSKFFNIENPHAEVRYNQDGKVSLCAIWIDFDRLNYLPSLISQVCLSDGVSKNKNLWLVQRGIIGLERPLSEIQKDICDLGQIEIGKILEIDKEKWVSLSAQEKDLFDRKSSLVCLLLRREFGDLMFSNFLQNQTDDFPLLFKFKDQSQFNSTASRFSENITKDINNKQTPEGYLIIR